MTSILASLPAGKTRYCLPERASLHHATPFQQTGESRTIDSNSVNLNLLVFHSLVYTI